MPKTFRLLSMCMLICTSIIVFGGCTNINYSFIHNINGNYEESFFIELDNEEISKYNIDPLDTIQQLDIIENNWWNNKLASLSSNQGINHKYDIVDVYTRKITITFNNIKAYNTFYNISQDTPQQAIKKEHIFNSELVLIDKNIQGTNIATNQIYMDLNTYLANKYYSGDLDQLKQFFDKINVNILFAYPASARVFSNADIVKRNNLISMHLWNTNLKQLNTDNVKEQKHMYVTQHYYTPNNIRNWYLLAIGITILFGIILFLCFYIKHKLNKEIKQTTTPDITLDNTIKDKSNDIEIISNNTPNNNSQKE